MPDHLTPEEAEARCQARIDDVLAEAEARVRVRDRAWERELKQIGELAFDGRRRLLHPDEALGLIGDRVREAIASGGVEGQGDSGLERPGACGPSPDVDALLDALEPFAGCHITDDGAPPAMDYEWPPMRERIVDWFSGAHFQRAREVVTAYRPEPAGTGAEGPHKPDPASGETK